MNQKARELLRYLQGSDARPERLQPEASKVVEPLPPVERTVSAQVSSYDSRAVSLKQYIGIYSILRTRYVLCMM